MVTTARDPASARMPGPPHVGGEADVPMTVFNTGPHANTTDFRAGDVGLVPRNCGRYVENTGDDDLIFIETFRSDHYEGVSLANWLSHLPPKLVSAHLNIPEETLATFPRGAQGIVPLP
jgi:oxalate decarboxylase